MSNVRILDREPALVSVNVLAEHPDNPNQGDQQAIGQSLDTNGQYRSILVQRSTGYILAGNTTYRTALNRGATSVDVDYLDVTDEAARRILLVDNGARRNAANDDQLLAELLADLPDLDGTGYEPGDLDDLTAKLDELPPPPPPGSSADDNVQQFKSLEEKAAGYQLSDQRQIILAYSGARYVWAVEQLGALAAVYGVESNAETVLKLIEHATNEHAPEAGQ